jgi:hypothetical protein
MSYADAINAALEEHREQCRTFGRLLAQAGMAVTEGGPFNFDDWQQVRKGHAEQLRDFPNG